MLLFTSYSTAKKRRPVKEPKGFALVSLETGVKRTLTIPRRIVGGGWPIDSGTVKVMVGGSSARLNRDTTRQDTLTSSIGFALDRPP